MNKKGVIEVQFNWIYVAVVGAVFLLVFATIAGNIRKSAKRSLERDATTYFDEIFTSLQGSENTEHSISLPDLSIEVDADKNFCYFYRIGDSDLQGRKTNYVPIFSPKLIKKEILSYSLGWDIPFRAGYFLYMTTPLAAYVLVGSDFSLNKLSDDLPNHLTKFTVSSSSNFENENYDLVRFISYTSDPISYSFHGSIERMDDEKVTALLINENEKSVTYYEKNDDSFVEAGKTYYMDLPTLFATIYSENKNSYECNLISDTKAVERLQRISDVLVERVDIIRNSNLLPKCRDSAIFSKYDEASVQLKQLKDTVTGMLSHEIIKMEDMQTLASIKNNLNSINGIVNRRSCPTVY